MAGSDNTTVSMIGTVSSLDGQISYTITEICGKNVSKIIGFGQRMNKKLLKGFSLEEADLKCDCGHCDPIDCFRTQAKEQDREDINDIYSPLVKVIVEYKKGDLSRARETLDSLCFLVHNNNNLSLNKVQEDVVDYITKASFQGFTRRSISDGLILLSCNHADISHKANVLNLLGILAVELSMPHEANEIFRHQKEWSEEHSECVNLLVQMIFLNNYMISCALSGQIIASTQLLDVREILDSVKERHPGAIDMCAIVLNNLGRVELNMGYSCQAENFLTEATELLGANGYLTTTQNQIWNIILHHNIFRLHSAKSMWKMAQEELELTQKSLLLLDIDDKSQISDFFLAEQVQLDLKMNQFKKANENFEKLLPILSKLNFWTPEMIVGEMDVLFLIKIAKILQHLGKIIKARDILKQISEVCHVIFESDHLARAELLYECGRVYCLLEDYRESVVSVIEATKIYENFPGEKHPRLISLYCKLAHVQSFHLGEKREARQNVEKAFGVLEQYHQEEKHLQLGHFKKLIEAGVLDCYLSVKLDDKCIDVTLSHEKLFSDQTSADNAFAKHKPEENVQVNLKCKVVNFMDLVLLSWKIMMELQHVGRPMECLEEALHSLSKADGSLSSQMLFHSGLGFMKALTNESDDNLIKALEIARKVVSSQTDKPESNVVLSSLALAGQALSMLGSKEKELMDVCRNMACMLSLDESKEFSDVYTHVLGGKMMYLSVQEVFFQEKSVTVNVMVNEELSMHGLRASHLSDSYQPTVDVRCFNGETDKSRILVLAKCLHKVDIETLRSLSRSVSQSIRQSMLSGVTLSRNFVVDVKTLVSNKSNKALCQEIELDLPLFVSEMSHVDDIGHSGKPLLCSSFIRFTCSRVFSPEALMSRFVVSIIREHESFGVLCDLSFRTNALSIFLEQPKVSIQLHCMGGTVELRTKFLHLDNTAELEPCPCSTVIQTVCRILLESSASLSVELSSEVDSRWCSNQRKHQLSLDKVPKRQQLLWKDEKIEGDPSQDMKREIQSLRQCLKRSTASVAVLQGVIEGLVAGELKQLPRRVEDTSSDPTCSSEGKIESSSYPLLAKGDRRKKLSQELICADSGIDSSDSERKRLKHDSDNCRKKLEGIFADEHGTCTGEASNLDLGATELVADSSKEVSSVPEKSGHKSIISDCFDVTANYSPHPSSSSESEDSFSEEGTSSMQKRNSRRVTYRIPEKQSIKRWCKSGKQRSVASLQHNVHRLERKLEQMTEEMKEMEKNYGEALFERDAAFRIIEKMKFDRELKQKLKRDRECMSADDERFEEGRSGHGSFDDGSGDNTDQSDQGGGYTVSSQEAADYPENTVEDTQPGHDVACSETPGSNETKFSGVTLLQEAKEIHIGDNCSGASSRRNSVEDESYSAASDSSDDLDVGGGGQGGLVQNATGSIEYQDIGKEDFDEVDGHIGYSSGNDSNLHKGLADIHHTDNFPEVTLGPKQEPVVSIGNFLSGSGPQMVDLEEIRGLAVVNKAVAVPNCKLGSVADSEKLSQELANDEKTRNISSCQFVGSSPQKYGDVAKGLIDMDLDVTKEGFKGTKTDTIESKVLFNDDHSFKKQNTVEASEILSCRPVESGVCQRLTEKEIMFKKEECKTSTNLQHCQNVLMDDEMQQYENEQSQMKSKKFIEYKHDVNDDSCVSNEGAAMPCGKQIQGDDCDATVTVDGKTEIFSTAFSDEPSKQVYVEQGAKPKKSSHVLSNPATTEVTHVVKNNFFLEQGARPKASRQSAHQRAWTTSEIGDSYLSNSPENTGLQFAFLARHTRDYSLSLHTYQESNNMHLSSLPLERSMSRPSLLLNATNSQSISSNSDSVITPDVQRYIWEVPNSGTDQQLVTINQQSRALNHLQSDDHFQSAIFANDTKDPQNEATGSCNTSSPFTGDIIDPRPQSQSDSLIPASGSKTLVESSSATRNSNFLQDHETSSEGSSSSNDKQTNTKLDSNEDNISKDKSLYSGEETGRRNVEERPPANELHVDNLENRSFSSKETSLDSVKENSNTLESNVTEACTVIKKLCMEKKAMKLKARHRIEKEKEEHHQVLKEDEEGNMDGEESANERQDKEATRVSTSAERGGNESYPVQESPEWLCEHYRRRCKVKFPCCNVYHACHRCHNNDDGCSNEEAKAHNATHVQCLICNEEQPVTESYDTQTCQSCGTKLSEYFCPKCKHFTGTDKKPYHCDKCGICRIHKDRSFHCEICNVCLDKRLEGKHKCRPDSGHDECCICLEDAFSGCQILPCSHKVHRDCAIAMIRNGIRTCPVCRHPLYNENDR